MNPDMFDKAEDTKQSCTYCSHVVVCKYELSADSSELAPICKFFQYEPAYNVNHEE